VVSVPVKQISTVISVEEPPPVVTAVTSSPSPPLSAPTVSAPTVSAPTVVSFQNIDIVSKPYRIKPVVSIEVKQLSTVIHIEETSVTVTPSAVISKNLWKPTSTPNVFEREKDSIVYYIVSPIGYTPYVESYDSNIYDLVFENNTDNFKKSLFDINWKYELSDTIQNSYVMYRHYDTGNLIKDINSPSSTATSTASSTATSIATSTASSTATSIATSTATSTIRPMVSVPIKQISTSININTPIVVNTSAPPPLSVSSTVDVSSVDNTITIQKKEKEMKDITIKNTLHKINVQNSDWGVRAYEDWYRGRIPFLSSLHISRKKDGDHYIRNNGDYIFFVKNNELWVRHYLNKIQPISLFETFLRLNYLIYQYNDSSKQNHIYFHKYYESNNTHFQPEYINDILDYMDLEELYDTLQKNSVVNVASELVKQYSDQTKLNKFFRSRGIIIENEEVRRAKEEQERRAKEEQERRAKEEEASTLKTTIINKLNSEFTTDLTNTKKEKINEKVINNIVDSWSKTDELELQKTLEVLQILNEENNTKENSKKNTIYSDDYNYTQILNNLLQRVNTRMFMIEKRKDVSLSKTVAQSKGMNIINTQTNEEKLNAKTKQDEFQRSALSKKIKIEPSTNKTEIFSFAKPSVVKEYIPEDDKLLCIGLKYEVDQSLFSFSTLDIIIKIEYSIDGGITYKNLLPEDKGKTDEVKADKGKIEIYQEDIIKKIGKEFDNNDLVFVINFDNSYSQFTSKTVKYERYTI
jgi:hypothetical protein